jgi:hypothetical protein
VTGAFGKAIGESLLQIEGNQAGFQKRFSKRKNWSERRDLNPRTKKQNRLMHNHLRNLINLTIHKYAHRF